MFVAVARSNARRSAFGPACVRWCGRIRRDSYLSAATAANTPRRIRRSPLGRVNSCASTYSTGFGSRIRTPRVRHSASRSAAIRYFSSSARPGGASGNITWTILCSSSAAYRARSAGSMTSYGGAITRLSLTPAAYRSPRKGTTRSEAMSFRDAQQIVDRWISQFEEGYFPPLANVARLGAEGGELARAGNHPVRPKQTKGDEPG